MHMPSAQTLLAVAAALSAAPRLAAAAPEAVPAEPSKTTTTMPCTASSTSGAFYDLRPDIAIPLPPDTKAKSGMVYTDYTARGYDYGANFTVNICGPVVKPVSSVMGVDKSLWANMSAYYKVHDEVFSLGQQSSQLTSRGRELVLQYTGGSPCPDLAGKASKSGKAYAGGLTRRELSGTDMERDTSSSSSNAIRRKSATFSFLCDRESADGVAHVSYVGTADECAYFFKVRSLHACAGAEPHKPGSVGPGGVFAIIFGVALLVYFIGGIVYQRTVAHARGWRQLPNYALWAGIGSFFRDFFIILTASCLRCLPHRRGYQTVSTSPNGRSRSRDDENRLIDQLDEEWDD